MEKNNMRKKLYFTFFISVFLLIIVICIGCAPKNTPKKNIIHQGNKNIQFPNGALKWSFRTGNEIEAITTGTNGTLYVCSNSLYALNSNGQQKWSADIQASYSPTIAKNGNIYIGSGEYFYVLDSKGKIKNSVNLGGELRSPAKIAEDGTIYVIINDKIPNLFIPLGILLNFSISTDYLVALTPTGYIKWKNPGDCEPLFGPDGNIYVADHDRIYCITPSGNFRWKFKLDGKYSFVEEKLVMGPDGTIYAVVDNDDKGLHVISSTGNLKWKFKIEKQLDDKIPAVGRDGTIYLPTSDNLYALDPTGDVKWKIGGDYLQPVLGHNDTIYLVEDHVFGQLIALTLEGNVKWRYDVTFESRLLISQDGTIYGHSHNYLYALTSEGNLKWKFKGDFWNKPCFSNKILYQISDYKSSEILFANQIAPRWLSNFSRSSTNTNNSFLWDQSHKVLGCEDIKRLQCESDLLGLDRFQSLAKKRLKKALDYYQELPSSMIKRKKELSQKELPKPPKLTKNEFETSSHFKKRVEKARIEYRRNIQKHNQKVNNLEEKIRMFNQKHRQLPDWKRNQIIKRTFLEVFGYPKLTDVKYDADTRTFYGTIVSDRTTAKNYQRTVMFKDDVPIDKARKLKRKLQNAKPKVKFDIGQNGELRWVDAQVGIGNTYYAMLPTEEKPTMSMKAQIAKSNTQEVDLEDIKADKLTNNFSIKLSETPEIRELQKKIKRIRNKKAKERAKEQRISELREKLSQLQEKQTNRAGFNQMTHNIINSLPESNEKESHGVAIIIGNRKYNKKLNDVPNVRFAYNDAKAIAHFARKSLGYREGNVIVLKDATKAQLETWFGTEDHPKGRLSDVIKKGKSEVFVYYSGHGVPGSKKGRGYLLPINASPDKVQITGYPIQTLYNNLSKLSVSKVTVAIDACFSGRSPQGALIQNASPAILKVKETRPHLNKGAVFTASAADQIASWDTKTHLGLFTRYWLEGASGAADNNNDGKISAAELHSYLDKQVKYQARHRYGRMQDPRFFGKDSNILIKFQ